MEKPVAPAASVEEAVAPADASPIGVVWRNGHCCLSNLEIRGATVGVFPSDSVLGSCCFCSCNQPQGGRACRGNCCFVEEAVAPPAPEEEDPVEEPAAPADASPTEEDPVEETAPVEEAVAPAVPLPLVCYGEITAAVPPTW